MITVFKSTQWHHGQTNCGTGGLSSQLTHCQYNGIQFYVRENVTGIPSFLVSSGERWGDKTGSKPRQSRQVLELLAPEKHFEVIKQAVLIADALHRPVLKNNAFTLQWIKNNIKF